MESELSHLKRILKTEDTVLVDSYQVTDRYFLELKKRCKVACLEDMGKGYPVDVLINYNIYGPELRERYQKAGIQKLLLGTKYMPLRADFRSDIAYHVGENVKNVVITTGGSDLYFATGAFLESLLADSVIRKEGIVFHVVSGPFNQFVTQLKKRYGGIENVVIHENVKNMKELLKAADVVITATGSTIYEVSILGVPMICFYFVENQRQIAQALEKMTDVVNAGCFYEDKEQVVLNVLSALVHCIRDKGYRNALYAQEKDLVDTDGAIRLCRELLKDN